MGSDGLPPPPSPAQRCMQVVSERERESESARERERDSTRRHGTALLFFGRSGQRVCSNPKLRRPSHLGHGEGLGFRVWGFRVSSPAGIWAAGISETPPSSAVQPQFGLRMV